jgi:hypothetical protein
MSSVIRKDIYDNNYQHIKLEKFDGKIQGVSGKAPRCYGVCQIPYNIGGYIYTATTLVADVRPQILLGLNMLEKYGSSIDYGTGEIVLGNQHLVMRKKNNNRLARLGLINNVILLPNTEHTVRMKAMNHDRKLRSMVMVESCKNTSKYPVLMGNTLSMPDEKGEVIATILNPGEERIVLERDKVLALATPVKRIIEMDEKRRPEKTDELPKHVRSMLDKPNLEENNKNRVEKVLKKYPKLFAPEQGPNRSTTMAEHHIDTGDITPIRCRTRLLPAFKQELASRELKKMIDLGVVEESVSPWAAPIVLVKKKDNSWRFYVDYRQLNNATKKDSYPLPNIQDTLSSLAGASYFCALDLASGYWQVPLSQKAKEKTAFVMKEGLYQFKMMPFGLCNAPATFERLMERVLRGQLGKRCLVYIDDVVV